MASSINASTSGAGGVITTADNTGILNLQTGGTTAVTVDASQNVGIGTSSPSVKLDVRQNTSSDLLLQLYNNSSSVVATYLKLNADNATGSRYNGIQSYNGATAQWQINGGGSDSTIAFSTGSSLTERMRINTNGNMLIGTTTEAANETRIVLSTNSGTTRWSVGPWSSVATNFYISATSGAQGVYLGGTTGTSWSGLSDERAKDIIEPIENAIEKVSTLRAVIGKYKSDDENNRKAFLIAQDVQAVLPEAVSIANPENGHLGLAYTDVIPLLVAAIKEQTQIINDLKARIETLEAK